VNGEVREDSSVQLPTHRTGKEEVKEAEPGQMGGGKKARSGGKGNEMLGEGRGEICL